MTIAVLFPGQGSQFLGMGQEFIKEDSECAALMTMAEEVCQHKLGSLCAEGPMEELTRAAILQPAITVTNLICWQKFKKEFDNLGAVRCCAGHSLGEYSALCAAGVISPEDTLRLVSMRGALMEREGKKNPGGMRAVIGLNIEGINEILAAYTGGGVVVAANHNTPEQIVLSGSMEGLDGVSKIIEESSGKVVPLNVSVANHSPLVADAVPDFARFMADIEFRQPQIPVYFNVSADKQTEPVKMKEMMANQIASKVRWCETIEAMLAEGVDTFVEIGPKSVLKGLVKKIVPKGTKVAALQFDSPASLAKCLEELKGLASS